MSDMREKIAENSYDEKIYMFSKGSRRFACVRDVYRHNSRGGPPSPVMKLSTMP